MCAAPLRTSFEFRLRAEKPRCAGLLKNDRVSRLGWDRLCCCAAVLLCTYDPRAARWFHKSENNFWPCARWPWPPRRKANANCSHLPRPPLGGPSRGVQTHIAALVGQTLAQVRAPAAGPAGRADLSGAAGRDMLRCGGRRASPCRGTRFGTYETRIDTYDARLRADSQGAWRRAGCS